MEDFTEEQGEFENLEINNVFQDGIGEEVPTSESQSQDAPLSMFKPPLEVENNIICQITPAKFDSLLKVLNVLITDKSSSNEVLIINNSSITQSASGAIVGCDIQDIFGSDKINLHIANPKKYIKLFKQFRNNSDIFILNDPDNSRFIVTNGEIKLFLPKQAETMVEQIKMPDLGNCTLICNLKVDKTTRNIISGLAVGVDYIEYLIQDNLLKAIHIPDTAIYLFNDYINDPKATKLDETNSDLSLRSTMSFPITAEDYEINIGKMPDGSYISATRCNTGFIKIDIMEPLEISTGGNILI